MDPVTLETRREDDFGRIQVVRATSSKAAEEGEGFLTVLVCESSGQIDV